MLLSRSLLKEALYRHLWEKSCKNREDGSGYTLRVIEHVGFSGGGGQEAEEGFHASPVRLSIMQKELRPSLEVILK